MSDRDVNGVLILEYRAFYLPSPKAPHFDFTLEYGMRQKSVFIIFMWSSSCVGASAVQTPSNSRHACPTVDYMFRQILACHSACLFLYQNLLMWTSLVSSPGSSCISFLSVEITGIHHHVWMHCSFVINFVLSQDSFGSSESLAFEFRITLSISEKKKSVFSFLPFLFNLQISPVSISGC